ncbi:putative membrane protein [Scopulibacillus daqui]|uniref:Membrane protein n=1 Tax=Scopulibacillus daqui TaxID=1469162 RepID=A0ABS2PX38_9BACL|nr:TIGR03943 family protein [Scopulibacillus daqui]MBM7644624.1 putative membrane protein [Scopulibacillus daqui]
MFRLIILFGFFYLFMHLHVTGDISKYINMKYSYLSYTMIFVFAFLTLYQMIKWVSEGNKKEKHAHDHGHCHDGHDHNHEHDHGHSHGEHTIFQKIVVYGLLLIPIATGLFLPVATLNSSIVKAKGFHFSQVDDGNESELHQVLRPDTSMYYNADHYKNMEQSDLKKYSSSRKLVLNDSNYLRALETIYNFPGNFENKRLTMNGFVYHDTADHQTSKKQFFLFRFGIIHCIADAGTYGMMVEFPKNVDYKDDQWLQVEGKISTTYYQPFQQTIPVLKVTKWQPINQPKDPYVYRQS